MEGEGRQGPGCEVLTLCCGFLSWKAPKSELCCGNMVTVLLEPSDWGTDGGRELGV